MRLTLTAMALAAILAWPLGTRAAGPAPLGRQANAKTSAAGSLDTARTYFDRAWKLNFPSAGAGAPYVLKAEFTTRASSGQVETGTYTDTWVSEKQWRREAVLGRSRFVRTRNGKKRYRLDEGPDAAVLQFVLTAIEPLPATNWLREGDWRMEREQVDGMPMVRVANGTPDEKDFNAYWFDETGQLVKTMTNGLETRRLKFADFNGIQVARLVEVLTGGVVGMRIEVPELEPAAQVDAHLFTIKKHDWDGEGSTELR